MKLIQTRITKGESIIGNKGNYLRVTESDSYIGTEPGRGRYAYGISEMFNAGEYFEYEMPVNYSSRNDTQNGGYTVTAPAKIVIDRRQEFSKPERVETSEGEVTYLITVTNKGNVAVGGQKVTDPNGKDWSLDGGKTVLQPGETGTITVKYEAGIDKDVTFKTHVSNQVSKTVTYEGKQFPKITWGNMLFAGNSVKPDTPIIVKKGNQLLFQIQVKNDGKAPAENLTFQLPNGEFFTSKQVVKPGETVNVTVPYTPTEEQSKGTTTLKFIAGAPGEVTHTYNVTIEPEKSPIPPTTAITPVKPPKSGETSTSEPNPKPSEPTKNLWDLGTVHITQPVELEEAFDLPLGQLKNPSNTVWADMYIMNEDGSFIQQLDDKDALVVVEPDRNFPKIYLKSYKPKTNDAYTGKIKEKFTIYNMVPKKVKGNDLGNIRYIEDFGTPVATFTYEIHDLVTENKSYFNPIDIHSKLFSNPVNDDVSLLPGEKFQPLFKLVKAENQQKEYNDGFDVIVNGKTEKLNSLNSSFYGSNNVQIVAPEKGKSQKVSYTFKPTGSDFLLNSAEITVHNVLKDDSRVPQVDAPRTVNGKIPAVPGEKLTISTGGLVDKEKITRVCDGDGKCFSVDESLRGVEYTPTEKDFKSPKRFYLVNDKNIVVGKMDLSFDQKLTEPMIELKNKDTQHKGYFGDSFTQEVIIHNYTPDEWNGSVFVDYMTKMPNGKFTSSGIHVVELEAPLKPGESTTKSIEFTPQTTNLEKYVGKFSLSIMPGTSAKDATDEMVFDLTQNPEVVQKEKVVSKDENYVPVNLSARFETNAADPVQVEATPPKGFMYTLTNTGSAPMVKVRVVDKLIEEGTGKEYDIVAKPLDPSFNGTLLPGQRVVFVAELPAGIDVNAKYHNSAQAFGVFPKRPDHGIDFNDEPDYSEDPSSEIIISPRDNLKSNAHIIVSEPNPWEIYTPASNPEKIMVGETNPVDFSRTYRNPDGSIITVSQDEVTFKIDGVEDGFYRYRTGKQYLEFVYPDGKYNIFVDDAYSLTDKAILRLGYDKNLKAKRVYKDSSTNEVRDNDYIIDLEEYTYNFVKPIPSKEDGRNFYVTGLDSIRNNFPYLTYNMLDYYQNVVGATETVAKAHASRIMMTPTEPENSAFVEDGKGGIVLSSASAESKGPGTYEEEFNVFDRMTFTTHKVTVKYTIHPDGTASVDKIIAPEGVEFDITLYRPKDGSGEVHVDEQGKIHDGSDEAGVVQSDRLKDRHVSGNDSLNEKSTEAQDQDTTSSETNNTDDTSKDTTIDRARSMLATTGIPAGIVATALLALVSMLGAIAIMRRGKVKKED